MVFTPRTPIAKHPKRRLVGNLNFTANKALRGGAIYIDPESSTTSVLDRLSDQFVYIGLTPKCPVHLSGTARTRGDYHRARVRFDGPVECLTDMFLGVILKAGPPWFEFLVIFDFFAPWYRKSKEASSVKISWKNSKEKLVKCATEVARLHKVSIQSCTRNRPSPKVQSLSRDWI